MATHARERVMSRLPACAMAALAAAALALSPARAHG
ncbi:hypothetical protein BURMUCF2_2065, partial [Burkholderia multivorans CF2]